MSHLQEFPIPASITIQRDPASAHHPILKEVKNYWEQKRGSSRMPARQDIDPKEIKSLLPQVLLVDVLAGGSDFRYRLLGSKLRPYFPNEATGQVMSVALARFGATTVAATLSVYRTVALEQVPLRITGPGETFAQSSKFFEAVLLPLGGGEAFAHMIFGAFEFDWILPAAL
jgi:hypothetical protein